MVTTAMFCVQVCGTWSFFSLINMKDEIIDLTRLNSIQSQSVLLIATFIIAAYWGPFNQADERVRNRSLLPPPGRASAPSVSQPSGSGGWSRHPTVTTTHGIETVHLQWYILHILVQYTHRRLIYLGLHVQSQVEFSFCTELCNWRACNSFSYKTN